MVKSQLSVSPIRAFNDNYIWLISNVQSKDVILVDPGDAEVCIQHLTANHLNLVAILITHHHKDHTGGIKKLKAAYPNISIYGPARENIDGLTDKLAEADQIAIDALGISFNIIDVPGHTAGHIAYYHPEMLFCGDALFSGGCGRLFEGTAAQMTASLNKLAKLPPQTPVYCTHEYTLANLNFAVTIEPNNQVLADYYNKVTELRQQDLITLPSNIGHELAVNPFLRCDSQEVIETAKANTDQPLTSQAEIFAVIRRLKDNA